MGADIVAQWKDPLSATGEGTSPVGRIELAAEAGGLMPVNTHEMFSYGCCEGGSWFDGTFGCCM